MRYEKPILRTESFDVADVITLSEPGNPSLMQNIQNVINEGENMLNNAFGYLQGFGSGS